MKKTIFIILVITPVLFIVGCNKSNRNDNDYKISSTLVELQQPQLDQFLKLFYSANNTAQTSSSETASNDSLNQIKGLITDTGYQNLIASGILLTAQTCAKDFSCELSVDQVNIAPDSSVENLFNFTVNISVKFADGKTIKCVQSGQATVFQQGDQWLVDNFYEDAPNLYNQILVDRSSLN